MPSGLPIASAGFLPGPNGLLVASDGLLGAAGAPTGMTPLDARLGLDQGRREEAGGGAAFWLGSAEEGRLADLIPGDFVELVRTVDLTEDDLVSFSGSFTTPRDLPGDRRWRLLLLLDGVEVAGLEGWPGYTRQIDDLKLNASKLSGDHEIAIRLQLEAVV